MKDRLDAASTSDAHGARNILALFGWSEDDTSPEAFAGAQQLAKAVRYYIEIHTEKTNKRKRR